jgi:hypothetical protein
MSAPNITKWIGTGLLGLPLYGALTCWSSLDPQPDPNTHYETFGGRRRRRNRVPWGGLLPHEHHASA